MRKRLHLYLLPCPLSLSQHWPLLLGDRRTKELLLSSAEYDFFSVDDEIMSDSIAVVGVFLLLDRRIKLKTGDLNTRKEEGFLRAETFFVVSELASADGLKRLNEPTFLRLGLGLGCESGMLSTRELINCRDGDLSTKVGPCVMFLNNRNKSSCQQREIMNLILP